MAGSSINEPFVLATYNSILRGNRATEITPRTYASVSKRSTRSHEYVTIAAQANGIHILDVANLYPAISYTLGPSTFFACQPVTVSSSNHISITYAVISSSPELASLEDAGRTIWIWETDSSSKTRQKPKRTKTIFEKGQVVHALYSCYELADRIMALSNIGSFSILDGESLEARTCYIPSLARKVLYCWTFPRSIAGSGGRQPGVLVVILSSNSSSSVHLCTLDIDETDSISQTQETDIDLPSERIIDASCNSLGFLSILTNDGVLYSHNLHASSSGSSSLEAPLRSLQLTNFPFISSPSNSAQPTSISIHALTSSHILLASTHSNQDIILHIWDVQLAVLLASHRLPIPSSLLSASNLHLCLVSDSYVTLGRNSKSQNPEQQLVLSSQAYLIVSSVPLPSSGPKSRKQNEFAGAGVEFKLTTTVFTVPYTVPKVSTIAAAVGRGHISGPWLKDVESSEDPTKPQTVDAVEKNLMLAAVRDAVRDGRPQAAEAAFLNWTSTLKERTDGTASDSFEYNFVQELLEIVLFPSSDPLRQKPPTKQAYAPEIIRFLLEQRVVNSGMLASRGGILSALRMHADWKCIELAFDKVIDLTELEITETLRVVLAHHRRPLQTTSTPVSGVVDAMQIDSEPSVATSQATSKQLMTSCPNLISFLQHVVTYPTSRVPLLLSFRRCMQNPEDVTTLLKILSDWIAKSTKAEMDQGRSRKMMPTMKDLKKTKEGVWIVTGRKGGRLVETEGKVKKTEVLPPLDKITSFIQTLLDSSFLLLLYHVPSHNILRKLSSQLTPEIAFVHAAQNLRGALEPFAIAQEKAVKASFVSKEDREKDKQKVDWRQRRIGVGALGGAGIDVGVYTLEELVL